MNCRAMPTKFFLGVAPIFCHEGYTSIIGGWAPRWGFHWVGSAKKKYMQRVSFQAAKWLHHFLLKKTGVPKWNHTNSEFLSSDGHIAPPPRQVNKAQALVATSQESPIKIARVGANRVRVLAVGGWLKYDKKS